MMKTFWTTVHMERAHLGLILNARPVMSLSLQLEIILLFLYDTAHLCQYLSAQLKAAGSRSGTWKLTCLSLRGCFYSRLWSRGRYFAVSVPEWSSPLQGGEAKGPRLFWGRSVSILSTVSGVCGRARTSVWLSVAELSVSAHKPWLCPLWVSLNSTWILAQPVSKHSKAKLCVCTVKSSSKRANALNTTENYRRRHKSELFYNMDTWT